MAYPQRTGEVQWEKLYEYLRSFPRIHSNNEEKTGCFVECVFWIFRSGVQWRLRCARQFAGFYLTLRQAADCKQAASFLEDKEYEALLADKGHDTDEFWKFPQKLEHCALFCPRRTGKYSANMVKSGTKSSVYSVFEALPVDFLTL